MKTEHVDPRIRLIDTTIAVDHLRGNAEAHGLLASLLEADQQLAASEIVRFELLAGVREKEMASLEEFFEIFDWIPVNESITRTAADMARKFKRAFNGIDDADYLIAATSIYLDAELLTTNLKHFPMLDGLEAPY